MRIGISCYPTFGGSGVVATELAMALADGGDEVHVISYALPSRLSLLAPSLFFHEVVVPHYPLFVLAGLLPWVFLSSSLSTSMPAFTDHGELIRKVAFDREALVLARVAAEFVHFVLGYALVVVPLAAWTIGGSPAAGRRTGRARSRG